MRPAPFSSGPLRRLLPLLCLLACASLAPALTASAQTTTFTGKVYSPLGPNGGDPIPNIFVFAVDPNYPPPVFTPGVVAGPTGPGQNNCALQPTLIPASVLGSDHTNASGVYTFNTSGVLPNPLTIVIQAGKWRGQFQYTSAQLAALTQNGVTTLPGLSMPSSQSATTNLPKIAVVTGSADSIECIFNQIGISNSEITDPSGSGSINLFEGLSAGGGVVSSSSPSETTLVSTSAAMDAYDLIMFGCQGGTGDKDASQYSSNLYDYTNNGGRVFTTHFEYIWLENSFPTVATWFNGTLSTSGLTTEPATIETNYPAGATLAQWMQGIGALASNNPPTVDLTNVRNNVSTLNTQIVQSVADLVSGYAGSPSMQFVFDTPIGATGTPTVTIAFTNNSKAFLQGDTADSVTVNVANTSNNPTSPGLTLTLSLPGGLTATGLSGGANTGWVCNLANLTCVEPAALGANAADPVTVVFNVSKTALGQESLTAALSGGGLSGGQQCGRVLYNDYHVETPVNTGRNSDTGVLYNNGKNYCPTLVAPSTYVAKFLEYSLYDISNFVSPSTSDLIQIQGPTSIVWRQPTAIPYGTALSATQLDATAVDPESTITVPGTFVYTPVAGTIPNAGNLTLSVAFTPTDTVDYLPSTGTIILQVNPDATTTTLTDPNPAIFYGQAIAQNSIESVLSSGPATTLDGGTITFAINNTVVCTDSTLPSATVGAACLASALTGQDAGTYTIQAAYTGDNNFSISSSTTQSVVIHADPTTTTLANAGLVYPGQPATFTATIADIYATALGTATFYDYGVAIGTSPVTQGTAQLSTSTLTIGLHSLTACYTPVNGDFLPSCSGTVSQVVALPPTVTATISTLASNNNPSVLGQGVTFTTTVGTTGAFIATAAGTVQYLDGTTVIGTGTLANGIATFTTAALTVGTHNITAAYIGSTAMGPSTSPVVVQIVNTSIAAATTGFIMTVSPTTFNLGAGSTTSVSVSVLELNNFNQPIALTCAGLPAESTCTFGTSTIPAGGGTTTLTIAAAAPHTCGTNTPYFTAGLGSLPAPARRGLPILATFLFIFFARRRRALKGLVLAAMLCIIPAITGCGTCTDLGVKPATYTFTVTGTAGSNGATPVANPPGVNSGVSTTSQTQTMTMTVTI